MAQAGASDYLKRRREQRNPESVRKPAVGEAPTVEAFNPLMPQMDLGQQPDALGALLGPMLRGAMSGGGMPAAPSGVGISQSGGSLQAAGVAPERTSLATLQAQLPKAEKPKNVQLATHDNFQGFITDPATLAGLAAFASAMFDTGYDNAGQQVMGGITNATGAVARHKGNLQATENARAQETQDARKSEVDALSKLGGAYKDVNTMQFVPEYLVPAANSIKLYEAQVKAMQARAQLQSSGLTAMTGLMGLAQRDTDSARQFIQQIAETNPELLQDPAFMQSIIGMSGDLSQQSFNRFGTLAGTKFGRPGQSATADVYKKNIMAATTMEDLVATEQQATAAGLAQDPTIQTALAVQRMKFINEPQKKKVESQLDTGLRWVINNAKADPAKAEAALAQYEASMAAFGDGLDSKVVKLHTNAKAAIAKAKKVKSNGTPAR